MYYFIVDQFEVDDDDHCETPENAYEDVKKCVTVFSKRINKSLETISIYDPFYCQGSMITRLSKIGIPSENIYNRKEDFYFMQRTNAIPAYDILLTNPPYSAQHMGKLIRFVCNSNKPYMLLLPNYVYMKDYYQSLIHDGMFYIVPNARYLYTTPNVSPLV